MSGKCHDVLQVFRLDSVTQLTAWSDLVSWHWQYSTWMHNILAVGRLLGWRRCLLGWRSDNTIITEWCCIHWHARCHVAVGCTSEELCHFGTTELSTEGLHWTDSESSTPCPWGTLLESVEQLLLSEEYYDTITVCSLPVLAWTRSGRRRMSTGRQADFIDIEVSCAAENLFGESCADGKLANFCCAGNVFPHKPNFTVWGWGERGFFIININVHYDSIREGGSGGSRGRDRGMHTPTGLAKPVYYT